MQPGQDQSAPEDENNVWAHCLVIWGNLLYEYSQILAAVGEEWKPSLDIATNNFRTAGCPEADIRQALKNHTMKDEIDLGPEPEPEKVTHHLPHSVSLVHLPVRIHLILDFSRIAGLRTYPNLFCYCNFSSLTSSFIKVCPVIEHRLLQDRHTLPVSFEVLL